MGLPAKRALASLWTFRRPDVVHIVTEGPLGWSALQAAAKLKLPVISDFSTNFHAYSDHYGVGWLKKPILAYLRKFHNRTLTMVPTEPMRAELAALGFQRLRVIARGVDTPLFDPPAGSRLRARWGAGPGDGARARRAAGRGEESGRSLWRLKRSPPSREGASVSSATGRCGASWRRAAPAPCSPARAVARTSPRTTLRRTCSSSPASPRPRAT